MNTKRILRQPPPLNGGFGEELDRSGLTYSGKSTHELEELLKQESDPNEAERIAEALKVQLAAELVKYADQAPTRKEVKPVGKPTTEPERKPKTGRVSVGFIMSQFGSRQRKPRPLIAHAERMVQRAQKKTPKPGRSTRR